MNIIYSRLSRASLMLPLIMLVLFLLSCAPAQSQWKRMNNPAGMPNISSIMVCGKDFYAVGINQLYRTSDNGMTWKECANGLPRTLSILPTPSVMGNELYIGVQDSGIYRYDPAIDRWSQLPGIGLPRDPAQMEVYSTFVHGPLLFASVLTGGKEMRVFRSMDTGKSWEAVPAMQSLNSLVSSDSLLFQVGRGALFISSDNGDSWSTLKIKIPEGLTYAFATDGNVWIAGGLTMGIALSYDKGEYWHQLDESHGIPRTVTVESLVMRGRTVLSSGSFNDSRDAALHISGDNGESWQLVNKGTQAPVYFHTAIGEDYAYIYGSLSMFYAPLSELLAQADVPPSGEDAVSTLQVISDNTGNPSSLAFHLPAASDLTLTIFDMQGTERATVARGRWEAGDHRIAIDTENLPAGVYYCRLSMGATVTTRPLRIVR